MTLVKTEESCDIISKDVLERQIVASGDSVSQIKIVIDAFQKSEKIALEFLNDWYQKGIFDYLSCLYSALSQELPKNIFFRASRVFGCYVDICERQSIAMVIDVAEKCYAIAGANLPGVLALEKVEAYLSRYPEDIENAIAHCEHTNPYGNGSQHVWIAALASNGDLYLERFLSWIDAAENEDEIATAMRTLAQIPEKAGGITSAVADVVERIVKTHGLCLNDDVKGALYQAVEAWRKVVDCQHGKSLEKIANILLNEGCPVILYLATRDAWLSAKQQSIENVDAWLSKFVKVDPQHKGSVENLSYYLHELLDICPEKVFTFVENYSREHSCGIMVFNEIIGKMTNSDETLRNKYFTRWLASDSISVARNVYEIVSHVRIDTQLRINVAFEPAAKCSDEQLLLVCLRAIGWLYMMPETCIGFLVSCACKMGTVECLKSIYADFFYLVVLNYMDEYKRALEQIPAGDRHAPCYEYLRELAIDADKWWEQFKAAGACAELSPSIRHKELYAKYRSEVYGKAMKEARDMSILSHIAHNICLLHGRGWIVPVHTEDGEKMEESLLKRFSASIRISRLSEIEEHTLETRLTELRCARWEMRP